MGKLLKLLLIVISLLTITREPAMADNMDHGYYAKIISDGSAWSPRVNDLHVRDNLNIGYGNSTGNIGRAVNPGRNTLSLILRQSQERTLRLGNMSKAWMMESALRSRSNASTTRPVKASK